MSGHDQNSEWDRRMQDLLTDRTQVNKALSSSEGFAALMRRYRAPACGYLEHLILREKLTSDAQAARMAAETIWKGLLEAMPESLAEEWGGGGKSFRFLLRQAVHQAFFYWVRPEIRKTLNAAASGDPTWDHEAAPFLLAQARERLEKYQRENEKRGNLYATVFRLWEEHRDESLDALNARLAAMPRGRRLDARAFRQALVRSRNLFGRYLFDEVSVWVAERDGPGQKECREAFEELGLMIDYGQKSKDCRWLLGIEDDDEDEEADDEKD